MDKVKIKRAKRNKRKITAKEKLFAGIGFASLLSGGGAAAAKQPTSAVSSRATSGTGEKIARAVKNIFGVKTAEAAGNTIPTAGPKSLNGGVKPPGVIYNGAYYELNGEEYKQSAGGSMVLPMLKSGGIAVGTIVVAKKYGSNIFGKLVGRIMPGGNISTVPGMGVMTTELGPVTLEQAQLILSDPVLMETFNVYVDLDSTLVTTPSGQQVSLANAINMNSADALKYYGLSPAMQATLFSLSAAPGLGMTFAPVALKPVVWSTISFAPATGGSTLGGVVSGVGQQISGAASAVGGAVQSGVSTATGAVGGQASSVAGSASGAAATGGQTVTATTGLMSKLGSTVGKVMQAPAKFIANLLNIGMTSATLIFAGVVTGAMIGIQHWRKVAYNNMLKVKDTQAIEAVMPTIIKITDTYNSTRGQTMEEETALYLTATENITELFNAAAAKFQRQQSLTSQRGYVEGFLNSMEQTYTGRIAAFANDLNQLTVFVQPDGTRSAGTGLWGEVFVSAEGKLLSYENQSAEIPPSPSLIAAIVSKENTVSVPSKTPPPPPARVPGRYEVYGTSQGKMVYVAGYGIVTIKSDGKILNAQDQEITLPADVLSDINAAAVIPVEEAPPAAPVVYDVYLTDRGREVYAAGFGDVIILSDGRVVDQNGNAVNLPADVLSAINQIAPKDVRQNIRTLQTAPAALEFKNLTANRNLSVSAGFDAVKVGDAWQIKITGEPGAEIVAVGGKKVNGIFPSSATPMGILQTGERVFTGTFAAGDKGEWQIEFKVGGRSAGIIRFNLQDSGPTYSSVSISSGSLPAATARQAYSAALAASGGVGAYSWRLETGSLPGGLNLSPQGVISGTANTPGDYAFALSARDSQGNTISKKFTLKVNPSAAAAVEAPPPLQTIASAPRVTNGGSIQVLPNQEFIVTGSNFNTEQTGANLVMFGNTGATVLSATASEIKVWVPANLAPGKYTVKVLNLFDTTKPSNEFQVTVLTPQSALNTVPQNAVQTSSADTGIPVGLETYVTSKLKRSKSYPAFEAWANSASGKAQFTISGKNPSTGQSFSFKVNKQQAKNIISRLSL